MALLIRGGPGARQLLRRVASRRRGRCELSLVSAMIALVQKDRSLFAALTALSGNDFEVGEISAHSAAAKEADQPFLAVAQLRDD